MQVSDFSRHRHWFVLFTLLAVLCLSGAHCGSGGGGAPNPATSAPNLVSPINSSISASVVTGSGATSLPSATPQPPISDLVNAINQFRSAHGLSTLSYDPGLAAAAQIHTDDMVNRNYFALVSPDGLDVFTIYNSSTFTPRQFSAGQYLIAQGTSSGVHLFTVLDSAPATQAVLVNPAWNNIGVGYNVGFGGTWTIFFST